MYVIRERKETISSISRYLFADAWFSKKPFIFEVMQMGLHVKSRYRDDADLKYLNNEPQSGKRGRPRKFAGKIDSKNIDKEYFMLIDQSEESAIHTAIVYFKSLKCNVRLVHVTYPNKKGNEIHKLYFCTDTQFDALDILNYYKSRFQIEFLYRDGKQFTGLNDSQSRSENKLHFHFNACLTAINIAKVVHWLSVPKELRKTLSISDVKTMNQNRLLLQRFIDVFGINAYSVKNQNYVNELIYYGTIAA